MTMNSSEFKLNLAVVVGINDYQNGVPALGTARQDAEAIAKILRDDYHYRVTLITDTTSTPATLENLRRVLEINLPAVMRTVNPSRLLFYFAGHGIALNGEDGPQGYLIPSDAKLGDVSTYLPMQQMETALSKLSCRHCLVILDCCFAGAFRWASTRNLSSIPETIHKERFDRFIQDPAWQVITSAASDQVALDNLQLTGDRGIAKSNTQHSPFANALIEALSGSADAYPPASNGKPAGDGIITATELYLYLRDAVEIPTDDKNQRQTPQIWCLKQHDKGEFIFLPPGHELNLLPAPSLDGSSNPYRGLESFDEAHKDLFFGRQALTQQLAEFVIAHSLTVVLGASGSGKSSLVKAGLIPKLRQRQDWNFLPPFRPGESPFKTLNLALEMIDEWGMQEASILEGWFEKHPQSCLLMVIDQLEELITLCRDEQERQRFLEMLARAIANHPKQLHLVLTLRSDFEAQFRNTPLESAWQAARFIVPAMTREELRQAIEEPASAKVMYFEPHELVDRLIDEVANMPGALPLLSFALSELYLTYLKRQEAAKLQGETIDRAITQADYEELGGVTRSIAKRAEQEYTTLVQADPAYDQTIRNVMLRMVSVGGELARRRVPLSELAYPEPENTQVKTVLERFATARLLTSGTDTDGQPYQEPAHDALVQGWKRLLDWKQQEGESLLLKRKLTPAAVEWNSVKNKDEEQLKGKLSKIDSIINWLDQKLFTIETLLNKTPAQLVQLLQTSQNKQVNSRMKAVKFLWDSNPYISVLDKELHSDHKWLNQIEGEFVQESILQKRRNLSWRWRIAIGIIAILSLLTIASLVGQRNSQIGQAQASRQATEANLLSNQGLDALVNALRAGRTLEKLMPFGFFKPAKDLAQVRQVLQKTIDQNQERSRLEIKKLLDKTNGGILADLNFSTNNRLLATIISRKTAELWDVESQMKLRQFDTAIIGGRNEFNLSHFGPDDGRLAVRFSPDGSSLAIQQDGAIQLWDVQSKQLLMELPINTRWDDIFFSPNGHQFLAASNTGDLRLFNLTTRQWLAASIKAPGNFTLANVIWSDSGEQLMLFPFNENGMITWDLNNQILVRGVINSKQGSTSILSPNRKFQVTIYVGNGQSPPNYELWNLADNQNEPKLVHSFAGYHPLSFGSVIWSNDGKKTAIIDSEGIVRLWFLDKQGLGENLQAEAGNFDSQGSKVGRFSDAWDLETKMKLEKIKEEIKKKFSIDEWNGSNSNGGIERLIDDSNLTFSPDRNKLAIVDDWKGRFFYFWDLETQEELKVIREALHTLTSGRRQIAIEDLSFSPDGKFLAITDSSNLRLWDLQNDQWSNVPFQGDKSCDINVVEVDFSPNSQLIATGSEGDKPYVCLRDLSGYQLAKFEAKHTFRLGFSYDSTLISTRDYNSDNITQIWRIESFNELMVQACNLVHDYLNAPNSDANERDRNLCDGIH
jgi:WD40 repeat protein